MSCSLKSLGESHKEFRKYFESFSQPRFGDWAFNVDRGEPILKHWNKIPDNTDVLLTHGPALGYGDRLKCGGLSGCSELFATITDRVQPKFHICGPIHEGDLTI